jgi:NAD(P)H-flavin reductase
MKYTLPLIALGIILTGCSKAPSDAVVAKKLPGAWHFVLAASPDAKGIIFTFSPDGNFTNQIPTTHPDGTQVTMVLTGTFQVRDGYLIETITNISNYSGYLPVVERYKIVQSDDRKLIFVDKKTAKKITIEKDTP